MKTQVIALAQVQDALQSYAIFGQMDAHIFAAAVAVRIVDGVRIHFMDSTDTGSAYDWTQVAVECKDGDLIVCGETVAVMVSAWPTAVRGAPGAFHTLSHGSSWAHHDGGKYENAAQVARSLSLQ
ncbi:hypothetical protein [Paraburkholderia largidicola]|uniref:Uncharacterized protein n=1 Tax=Paraburkholderia largidicola TaxID=3014751 RepID=A0A7I8C2W1_9BURK|nr:hypothetical protein [Paraburkholderia sp. PGU16]BCF95397.1 hypothetical protein PPGU16_84640 [Paraburkholderia sp. PGU16]